VRAIVELQASADAASFACALTADG